MTPKILTELETIIARLIIELAQVRIENERLRLAVKRVGGGK